MQFYFILLRCTAKSEKHQAIRFYNWNATQSVSHISIIKMKVSRMVQITAVMSRMSRNFLKQPKLRQKQSNLSLEMHL